MAGLVFDTDIGSDVDDLLALVTAWGSGVTFSAVCTVYGDTTLRARLVRDAYAKAGRACPPVAAGLEQPRSGREIFWAGHEGRHLDTAARAVPVEPIDAVATVQAADEVLAVGPLTNLAAAVDAGVAADLRATVMGGHFDGRPEHNIRCDVDAAATFFASGIPADVIGTDQTLRVRCGERFVAALPATPLGELIRAEIRTFWSFMKDQTNAPHDALAVLMRSDPELFTFERGVIRVETEAEPGSVRFTPDRAGPHRVVRDLDVERAAAVVEARILDMAAG